MSSPANLWQCLVLCSLHSNYTLGSRPMLGYLNYIVAVTWLSQLYHRSHDAGTAKLDSKERVSSASVRGPRSPALLDIRTAPG